MILSRRSLITGLISLVAAPAIVRVSSLMPVKVMEPTIILPPITMRTGDVVFFQERFFWLTGNQIIHFSDLIEPGYPVMKALEIMNGVPR